MSMPNLFDLLGPAPADATRRASRRPPPMMYPTLSPSRERGNRLSPETVRQLTLNRRLEPVRTGLDVLSLLPGIGDARSLSDAVAGAIRGDPVQAGLGAVGTALAAAPLLGTTKRLGRMARFAETVDRDVAQKIVTLAKASGGATINPMTGEAVKEGFAVGGIATRAKPHKALTPTVVQKIIRNLPEDAHFGIWKADDGWHVEAVNIVPDKETAVKLGTQRKERAIGDLSAYARGENGDVVLDFPAPSKMAEPVLTNVSETPLGSRVFEFDVGGNRVTVKGRLQDKRFHVESLTSDQGRQSIGTGGMKSLLGTVKGMTGAESVGGERVFKNAANKALHAPVTLSTSPEGRALSDFVTPQDQPLLQNKATAKRFDQIAQGLPEPSTLAAGAVAGEAKRGWYESAVDVLGTMYGPKDAPRMASLIAALSPQTSVEMNLQNALSVWDAWKAAGRPTGDKEIKQVLGRALGGGSSVLPAWSNNVARALSAENPASLRLSGPKVNAFAKNLQGDPTHATLDTWMAKLANMNPKQLAGRPTPEGGVPHGGYLAYGARLGQTADELSRATGSPWTPAQVQETLWSWGKTHHENLFDDLQRPRPVPLNNPVQNTVDFASLLGDPGAVSRVNVAPRSDLRLADPRELEKLKRNMEQFRQGLFALGIGGAAIGAGAAPRDSLLAR